jgi:hypothetical protein
MLKEWVYKKGKKAYKKHLEGSIKLYERQIKSLKKIKKRLKSGERIWAIKTPTTYIIYPELKYVKRDIKHYEERIPILKKKLKKVI